jgi:ADP-heptose:LPS heptosyltransferase
MSDGRTLKSILVVRIGRLGDFLVALPALVALRRRYPRHQIVLVTAISASRRSVDTAKRYTAPGALPWVAWVKQRWVDEAIVMENIWSMSGLLGIAARLRAHDIERAYVLPFHGETALSRCKKILWLRVMGYWGPIHPRLVVSAKPRAGCSLQMQAPWQYVGGDATDPSGAGSVAAASLLTVAEKDRYWAASAWLDSGRRRVAMFPGATFAHKQWPAERFAEVVRRLEREDDCEIAMVGGAADREVAEQVLALSTGVGPNFCGKTTLDQLTALLQRAELWVGNDGGPAHLAAAFGVPTVTVMSGVHLAGVWDPSGARSLSVRSGPLPCFGCGGEYSCRIEGNPCMTTIPVEAVLAACRYLLGTGPDFGV